MTVVQYSSPDKNNQTDVLAPLEIICDYLNSQHVLALCCHDRESSWCASCFYVFERETMSFLIMTDGKTRHGQLIEKNPQVVGTISEQQTEITDLKGIQFSGSISLLIGEKEDQARQNYYDRFPIAKMIPSPIWRLTLDEVKMTDNTAGFASKYLWKK